MLFNSLKSCITLLEMPLKSSTDYVLKQQKFIFLSSGGQKFKIKVSVSLISPEASILGLQMVASYLNRNVFGILHC